MVEKGSAQSSKARLGSIYLPSLSPPPAPQLKKPDRVVLPPSVALPCLLLPLPLPAAFPEASPLPLPPRSNGSLLLVAGLALGEDDSLAGLDEETVRALVLEEEPKGRKG
jgi:hypothetical protein